MEEINSLIIAIQILAAGGAMVRLVLIIIDHLGEDDKKIRNRKMRNVLIALLLIETCIGLGTLIYSYYGGGKSG